MTGGWGHPRYRREREFGNGEPPSALLQRLAQKIVARFVERTDSAFNDRTKEVAEMLSAAPQPPAVQEGLDAGTVEAALAVVNAAQEFIAKGTVLTVCDRGACQRVVERDDNTDPQAKLISAVEKFQEARALPTRAQEAGKKE